MSAQGKHGAGVRPLIVKGLEVAEEGDLQGALKRWQIAFQLDPTSRPAKLLVDLTEAYMEATATGISLPSPDFRAHLHDIGFDAEAPAEGESGPMRVPGVAGEGRRAGSGRRGRSGSGWGPGGSARVTSKSAGTGGPGAPSGVPREAPEVGRTMYGLPLREEGAAGRMGPIRPAWEAETTPPGVPPIGVGAERDRGPLGTGELTPQGLPVPPAGSAATAGVAEEDSSDPWADLGYELAEVPAEDWTLPPETAEASPAPSGASDMSQDPLVAPAWDASDGVDLDLSALDQPAGAQGASSQRGESSMSPLKDPFAVLDDRAAAQGAGTRPVTSPGVRFGPEGPAGGRGAAAGPAASPRAERSSARGGTEYGMIDLAEDEDEDLLPLPPESSPAGAARGGQGRSGRPEVRPAPDHYSGPRAAVIPPPERPARAASQPGARLQGGPALAPAARDTFDRQALWERARHQHSLGDFSSSQKILEEILARNPSDADARRLLEAGLRQREKRDLARLRSLDSTPRIALGQEQLVWQNLDAKKGFVLSRVDGTSTIRDIIDLVNLPRQETIQILADLVDEGILSMSG